MTADSNLDPPDMPWRDVLPTGLQSEADALGPEIPAAAFTRSWVAPGAMAAGLILGVLLAASFGIGSDIRATGGALFAAGTLGQNLTGAISGTGTVGPSFWSKDGSFCRVFSSRNGRGRGLSGIACRENGGWLIKIVTAAADAGELPASIKSTMQNLIVGAPLDPAAEQQARRQGWRPG